jgi:hypothetical protein
MFAFEQPSEGPSTVASHLQIRIHSGGACWFLDCDQGFERVLYNSGRAAEDAGRKLATRFAETGHEVELVIEDRSHTVAGAKLYHPRADRADDPTDPAGARRPA